MIKYLAQTKYSFSSTHKSQLGLRSRLVTKSSHVSLKKDPKVHQLEVCKCLVLFLPLSNHDQVRHSFQTAMFCYLFSEWSRQSSDLHHTIHHWVPEEIAKGTFSLDPLHYAQHTQMCVSWVSFWVSKSYTNMHKWELTPKMMRIVLRHVLYCVRNQKSKRYR